jgi:hypothetical protein
MTVSVSVFGIGVRDLELAFLPTRKLTNVGSESGSDFGIEIGKHLAPIDIFRSSVIIIAIRAYQVF